MNNETKQSTISEAESWYKLLYGNPHIGIIIVDKERMIVDVNPTFAQILGYKTPSELIGQSVLCIHLSNKTFQSFGQKHFSAVMNDEPLNIRYQLKKIDGSPIWVRLTGQPNQSRKGAFWTVIDINNHVLSEEDLKQKEYKFRMLADNTFDWEYWINQNQNYVFVSQACEEITGYSSAEFEANPSLMIELAQEDFKEAVTNHFSMEQDCSAPACSLSFIITTKTGEKKWIEHFCKPLFDENGEAVGRYGNNRDMTEHHKDKEEKQQLFDQVCNAKRNWEATMDCIDDLVLVVDDKNRIKRCNNRTFRVLNISYGDLLDQKWESALKKGGINFSPPGGRINECYLPGEDCWFLIKKYHFKQEDDTASTVITLHDMTENRKVTRELEHALQELKQSQSQLLQSEKMASIGQLAAGVAHEINNPMGFINQNLKTLNKYVEKLVSIINAQKEVLTAPTQEKTDHLTQLEKKLKLNFLLEDTKDLIDESLDGSERIQAIVKNLKSFSRVDQKDIQHVDLNDCMEATINIIWNELKYKIHIEKDYGELPDVTCYPQQISQVFMNLLINASHAIETKGIIKIRSWTTTDNAFVSITDDGSGIPDKNLKHIFEPFFTTKEVGKGTGLGLSMVYDIVASHHGDITVESTVGQRTTFTIQIPIHAKTQE